MQTLQVPNCLPYFINIRKNLQCINAVLLLISNILHKWLLFLDKTFLANKAKRKLKSQILFYINKTNILQFMNSGEPFPSCFWVIVSGEMYMVSDEATLFNKGLLNKENFIHLNHLMQVSEKSLWPLILYIIFYMVFCKGVWPKGKKRKWMGDGG